MQINLHQIGKKFNRDWIFKNINVDIPSGTRLAILGNNGSGKSTLIQIISGLLSPTEGSVKYTLNNNIIPIENVFQEISMASPYLELVEEMSLQEMINFHFSFKNRYQNISNEKLIEILGLQTSLNKEVRYFSSGMKQRTKLLLAIFSDVPCILLDEPCSNLDQQGIKWYQGLLEQYLNNRTLLICSNQEYEYEICDKSISITDYKSA